MRAFYYMLVMLMAAGELRAATLELVTSVPLQRVRQVVVDGDRAWAAQNLDGGALLDVSNPARPRVRRRFDPSEMQPVFFKALPGENLLLCADRFNGLVIYDVHQPDSPTSVGQVALPGVTTQMDVTQTTDGRRLALLARTGLGVDAVDITDPRAPFLADSFTTGVMFTQMVAIAEGCIYLADSDDGGLKALRVVAPGRFEPLYQVNLAGKCETLRAAGNRLYAGYATRGVRIFDLPETSEAAGSTPTLRLRSTMLMNRLKANGMALNEGHLVVAGGNAGVAVYDVRDADKPRLTGEFLFEDELFGSADAKDVIPCGGFFYVPSWEAGLLVLKER